MHSNDDLVFMWFLSYHYHRQQCHLCYHGMSNQDRTRLSTAKQVGKLFTYKEWPVLLRNEKNDNEKCIVFSRVLNLFTKPIDTTFNIIRP